MRCPQCDTPLRLVADIERVDNSTRSRVFRRFRTIDLLGVTALVALHFAAFGVSASPNGAEWPFLLYFTPTLVTCLLHLRLGLSISLAMLAHYLCSLAWAFLHSIGQNAAINAYNSKNPSPQRDYQLDLFANAIQDTGAVVVVGLIWAAAYGLVCFTAVSANQTYSSEPTQEVSAD